MIDIVVGAGFGDEGKGQTVSKLITERYNNRKPAPNYIVRFNGGHQAGHTVEYDGMRHVFSNIGAGTLQGIPTYWSKYCTVHPKALKKEFLILKELGITPKILIDPLCPITMPLDIICFDDKGHGTVGVGFGQTIQRNEDHFKLFVADLLNEQLLELKVKNIIKYYYPTTNFKVVAEFMDECAWIIENVSIGTPKSRDLDNAIFEGAQGILLDQDYGFFPNVTRSKCTAINALNILKEFNVFNHTVVHYITRSYSTRHGMGPFPQEKYSEYLNLRNNILETNVYNEYQGVFRKSVLDLDILNYAISMAEQDIRGFAHQKKTVYTCFDHHKSPNIPYIKDGKLKYTSNQAF